MVGTNLMRKAPLSQFARAIGYEFYPGGNFGAKIHEEDDVDLEDIIDFLSTQS